MVSISSAWLSVTVKKGLKAVQHSKIIQCHWENTFEELLLKSSLTFEEACVVKVQISTTDQFLNTHEVCNHFLCNTCIKKPLRLLNFCLYSIQVSTDALVYLCYQFHCKFVCFTLEGDATTTTVGSSISTGSKPNIFVIMMSAAHKIVLPHFTKGVVNIH